MGLSGPAWLVVCLVSQFNPRIYSLALSGHTEGGFAYALAPWVVVLADMAVASRQALGARSLAACLASGMLLALAWSSPFGITLVGALVVLLGNLRRPWTITRPGALPARGVTRAGLAVALVLGVAVVLHLHWILPPWPRARPGPRARSSTTRAADEVEAEYVHKYREFSVAAAPGHDRPHGQPGHGHGIRLSRGAPRRTLWWKPSAYALLALALLGLSWPGRPDRRLKWFAALEPAGRIRAPGRGQDPARRR